MFREDRKGKSGSSYYGSLQYCERHRPAMVVMENVTGVIEHKDIIVRDFGEIGYVVHFVLTCPTMGMVCDKLCARVGTCVCHKNPG